MSDNTLNVLARRMRDELRRELDHRGIDIADLLPYLQEAASPAKFESQLVVVGAFAFGMAVGGLLVFLYLF